MSTFIHHELLLLIRAAVTGAVLLLCYDLLKALRMVVVHSVKMIGMQDLLYWLCCTFFVFAQIYKMNEGILRLFMFIGYLAGAWLCYRTISPFFVKLCAKIMGFPVIMINFLIKWLLFPVRRCKLFVYQYVVKERLANWVILRKKGTRKK